MHIWTRGSLIISLYAFTDLVIAGEGSIRAKAAGTAPANTFADVFAFLVQPTRNSLDTFLSGALGTTLNQIYKNKSVGYIMWNDESPDGRGSDSRGHTKGVMGFTTDGKSLYRVVCLGISDGAAFSSQAPSCYDTVFLASLLIERMDTRDTRSLPTCTARR